MKSRSVKLGLESLESRKLCAADLSAVFQAEPVAMSYLASNVSYYNASKPADVDRDGSVSPIDALRLIDALNRVGSVDIKTLNAQRSASGAEGEGDTIGSVDTNNDGSFNPIDVLVVIDELNGQSGLDDSVMPTAFFAFDPSDVPVDLPIDDMLMLFAFNDEFGTEIKEVTVDDVEQLFEGNPDIEWVKRTSFSEEMPFMFLDDSIIDSPNWSSEDSEFLPVYATMNPEELSLPAVAVFSQNGLFAQVVRKNMAENTSVNPAPVTYFSSNFLKGLR
jgi:hypothetical protein